MAPAPYRSWVEISRSRIEANYRAVRDAVGPAVTLMPVVKADAYRHGAVEVSRLLEAAGAQWLAVSNVEEGITLRQAGLQARILVMADFLPAGRAGLLEFGLTPVLHSVSDIAVWNEMARGRAQRPSYHLKVDTGMGRLGTLAPCDEIGRAVRAAQNVTLEGLMTHFASVTDFTVHQTEDQMGVFDALCRELTAPDLRPPYIHMSSTGAIAYGRRAAWHNMVRPGHAIYGYTSPARGPAPPNLLKVRPALTWKAAVLAVKDVQAGSRIGYGGIFQAPKAMKIAVLAVGYADGLPHRLGNRGKVIVQGRFAPILGAVSMDVTTIDVSGVVDLKVGDAVTLLGTEGDATIDAQDMARVAGTISYSVLCGISSRVKRVYLD